MSEPWEDFAAGGGQAQAKTDTAPWEDFAQGGVIKSNATKDQYPLLTAIGITPERAATFNKVMSASPALDNAQGFAAFPNEILKQANLQNAAMLPFLGEAVLAKAPALMKAAVSAYFAKGAAEGLGTAAGKASVTGLPNLPISPLSVDVPLGQALMGNTDSAKQVGTGTTEQWQTLGELVNGLLMGAGAKGMLRDVSAPPTGITPEALAPFSRVPNERQLNQPGPALPESRQLPRFAETGESGMTQPSSGEVTSLRQTTGSQYMVDPKGQTVDVSQLTPWEEAELMRGPKVYSPPQQGPVPPPYPGQKMLPPPGTQIEAGPTTLKQTLQNVEGQLKGEEVKLPGQQTQKLHSGVGPDLEDIKDIFTPKARLLLRSPDQLKLKTEGQVDAGQLVNRLLNTVPGSEKETLEASGIREAFKPGQKASVKEVDEWVRDNGPKVEVRKLEAKESTKDDLANLMHQVETAGFNVGPNLTTGRMELTRRHGGGAAYLEDLPETLRPAVRDYLALNREDYGQVSNNESATARYTMVNPKPLDQMPGAVDLLVRVPVEQRRRSLSNLGKELPPKLSGQGTRSWQEGGEIISEHPKYTSSHYPTEGKNLLAHVRGYMETTADGKKVFHVFEVQSDWAQAVRDNREGNDLPTDTEPGSFSAATFNIPTDPLLKQYERLALKAAIEHARSQGADAIAISDAETAMMTEQHDRTTRHADGRPAAGGFDITQAPGMRLHYDRTLPKIAEELTGQKGERVEFGEHQNAFRSPDYGSTARFATREEAQQWINDAMPPEDQAVHHPTFFGDYWKVETKGKQPRPDLIFKNEQGQPKTSITARQYPLTKTGPPPYSTTGSRLYSGVPLPELEKVWDGMKSWFKGVAPDTKDWSPMRDPETMKNEIMSSKTATPITTKQAGITLPTEGPETTIADKVIDTKNTLGKKIASMQDLVNKGDKMYSPMDVVFDMADGGKATFDGPLFRNVRWPLDFDFNVELNLRRQKMEPVRDLIKRNDLKEKNGLRLGIYAMVQQGARDRLIENGVPATYIDNIVKTLTPAEKEVYAQARRQLDSMLPQVQQVAKDVLGLDVQPVKDYFPMHADWRSIPKPAEELAKPRGGDVMSDAVDFLQGDFTKRGTKTERGFTIDRAPDAKTALKLNFFDVYERHVKDVAHFVSSQKRLNEIAKVVRDPKFAEKYGDVTQKLTMEWLNAYAKQGRNINGLPQLDWMRKAIARGVLGFRVASQFVHLANVPLGMQRAGPVNYSRGLAMAMSEEGQAFLKKNLAETFERGGGELELLEKQGKIEKAAFAPQRQLDRWNSQATSLGIYLREGGTLDGPVNEKALAKARVEARRAVASPLYKDLPPMLRTQSGKILAQFQNTFMDQWSNIRYDLPAYLRDNPKQAMGLLIALSAMTMVESGIKHGAKKGLQAATGYEPKHADDDTYWKKVGHEALRRIPGYGQLSSMWEYGSSGVPLLDVVKEEGKAVKEAVTSEDATGRKLAAVKAATGAGELAGLTGVGQLSEVVQNAIKAKGYKSHEKRIQEVADKAGLDLSNFDQRLAGEAYMKESREPMTEQEKVRSAQAAMKNMSERRQVVMDSLAKEDKQWLKANRIEPPGFGDYIEKGKVRVPYTDKENKFATEMYKTEYETVISFLRNDAGFKQLSPNEQQLVANQAFRDAAKRAREQTEEVVKSGALVDKPKGKKRFSAFSPE